MNNKTLFIVLIALVGVFVLSKLLKGDKTRSFDPLVVEVDTSVVDKIEILRKAEPGKTVTLTRDGASWNVSDGTVSVPAPTSNVSPTLASLSRIEAQRIVARSRDKWPQYEVGDGSNQIKVFVNGRKTADLLIGAFKFDQARRSASTYVRRAGEDEVYLVEGFLAMQLTQGADSYRDNTIFTSTPENVTRIEYSLGDDLHVLTRDIAGDWYYAGMESIDSMAMAAYLNGLRNVSSRDFVTDEGPDESSEIGGLRISGNNMTPAEITLYQVSSDSTAQFILGSNMNTDTYFASDSSGVFKTLFVDLEQILLEL